MRIAVFGVGGVGGYFGWPLAQSGEDVVFIARSFLASAQKDTRYKAKRLLDAWQRLTQAAAANSYLSADTGPLVEAMDVVTSGLQGKTSWTQGVNEIYRSFAETVNSGITMTIDIFKKRVEQLGVKDVGSALTESADSLVSEIKALPSAILRPVENIIESARKGIIGLNKRITGLSTDIGGFLSKLNPVKAFTSPAQPFIGVGRSVIPEVNALPSTPVVPELKLSAPPSESQPIQLESHIYLDDREIGRAIAEYKAKKRMQDGETFSPSPSQDW